MIRASLLPLAALLLLGCAGRGAPAQTAAQAAAPLTAEERERLVQDLEDTRRAFLASVQGLSEAQLHYRPAPGKWTIAEVAEHIALAEERIFGNVQDKIMRGPIPKDLPPRGARDDERVRQGVRDRSTPRQAPEVLRPTGRFPTVDAAVAAFTAARDRAVEYVRSTQDDLRGHGAPHPALKMLDGYQWLLLLSGHCARHTAQIEEVKASPGFPRS